MSKVTAGQVWQHKNFPERQIYINMIAHLLEKADVTYISTTNIENVGVRSMLNITSIQYSYQLMGDYKPAWEV